MRNESEMSVNPYAPVAAEQPQLESLSDAAVIRQQHLSHEASIKSIGTLYLLAALIFVPIGIWLIVATFLGTPSLATTGSIGFFQLAFGLFQGMTGLALRQLKNWARVVAIIFSVIGLIAFPLGTLISAYFLYLLLSAKGGYIFSDQYQQVIAATPDMKYKTSIIVWIFLALLLLLIAVVIVGSLAA